MAYKKSDFRAEYFDREIKKYLAEDNITVSFSGFDELVSEYFDHDEYLMEELHELIINLNLWSGYLGGFLGVLHLKYERYCLDKDILLSKKDKKNDDEQLIQDIQQLTNRIQQIRLIERNINKATKFLNIAFWKCRKTLNSSMRTYTYRSQNY